MPANAGSGNSGTNKCGVSQFYPVYGRGTAPDLNSCKDIINQVSSSKHKIDRPKQIGRSGNCAFIAQPKVDGTYAYVGMDDIKDLVRDATAQWENDPKASKYSGIITLGENGVMPCDSDGNTQVEIYWSLGLWAPKNGH